MSNIESNIVFRSFNDELDPEYLRKFDLAIKTKRDEVDFYLDESDTKRFKSVAYVAGMLYQVGIPVETLSDDDFISLTFASSLALLFISAEMLHELFSTMDNHRFSNLLKFLSKRFLSEYFEYTQKPTPKQSPRMNWVEWLDYTWVGRNNFFDNFAELVMKNPNIPIELLAELASQ